MTTQQKRERIAELQKQLTILQSEVEREERACKHDWSEPVYDPIESPDMVFDHYEGHGSDPTPIYRRSGTKTKPRWNQTCKHCGKTRYTLKTRPLGHVPDFS